MNRTFRYLLVIIIIIASISCNNKKDRQLSAILNIVDSKPDSAILLLNNINQTNLSDHDLATYSLIYTIAQDKSGLDVDNDSLIRIAYNWYENKTEDSLYDKSQYYMGKYYALNDSTDKALTCFSKAIKAAKDKNDYSIQSMALLQSAVIIREYNPSLAIKYAIEANSIYNKLSDASNINKSYYILNIAECLTYKKGNTKQIISLGKKATQIALMTKDSAVIADAYQDMSVFYTIANKKDSALYAARMSYAHRKKYDAQALLSYALALYQADSIMQAKRIISLIKQQDYIHNGDYIYSQRRLIALREHNYNEANSYADSSELYLKKRYAQSLSQKDKYFKLLTKKEEARNNAQNESYIKSILLLSILIISAISITFLFLIFKQKKHELEIKDQEKQARLKMEISHKDIQLSTMRNFLLKKIDITKKLENYKNKDNTKIALSNDDWKELEIFLNNTDDNIIERIKQQYPNLTYKDIRFVMLIRLKIPTSCIATIYHIEEKSVVQKLYLIKNKFGINKEGISARTFIENY